MSVKLCEVHLLTGHQQKEDICLSGSYGSFLISCPLPDSMTGWLMHYFYSFRCGYFKDGRIIPVTRILVLKSTWLFFSSQEFLNEN